MSEQQRNEYVPARYRREFDAKEHRHYRVTETPGTLAALEEADCVLHLAMPRGAAAFLITLLTHQLADGEKERVEFHFPVKADTEPRKLVGR